MNSVQLIRKCIKWFRIWNRLLSGKKKAKRKIKQERKKQTPPTTITTTPCTHQHNSGRQKMTDLGCISFRKVDNGTQGGSHSEQECMWRSQKKKTNKKKLPFNSGPSKAQNALVQGLKKQWVICTPTPQSHAESEGNAQRGNDILFAGRLWVSAVSEVFSNPLIQINRLWALLKLFVYDSCRQIHHFRFCITVTYVLVSFFTTLQIPLGQESCSSSTLCYAKYLTNSKWLSKHWFKFESIGV